MSLDKIIQAMQGLCGSEFLTNGTLPKMCIHTPNPDNYSTYYEARLICKCGSTDWIDGEMDILKPISGFKFSKKQIHRCKKCDEIRLADLIQT